MSNNVNFGRSDDVLRQFRDRVNSERNMFYDQFNPSWTRRPFAQDFHLDDFEYPENFGRGVHKPRERYSSESKSDYVNPCYSDGTFKDRDSIPIKVIHESSKTTKPPSGSADRVRSLANQDLRKQRSTSAPPQREPKGVIRDNSCPDASINSRQPCTSEQNVTVIPVKVIKTNSDNNDQTAGKVPAKTPHGDTCSGLGASSVKKVKDPLEELIESVQNEVLALEKKVSEGPKSQKEVLYLDEMLTRQMLRLDNMEVGTRNDLRLARKAVVRHIQSCLDKLDSMRMDVTEPSKLPCQGSSIDSTDNADGTELVDAAGSVGDTEETNAMEVTGSTETVIVAPTADASEDMPCDTDELGKSDEIQCDIENDDVVCPCNDLDSKVTDSPPVDVPSPDPV